MRCIVASAAGLTLVILFSMVYEWNSFQVVSEPGEQEYEVYSAFLNELAGKNHCGTKKIVVLDDTSTLKLPDYKEVLSPPTPIELRITDFQDPSLFSDFREFCGICANEFVSRNMKSWTLHAIEEFPSVREAKQHPIVRLSRVGFNLWRNRAVLTFSADCSGSSALILEIGDAYLTAHDGRWTVERMTATAL